MQAKFRTPPQRPTSSTAAPPLSHTEDETPPLEIAFSFNTAGAYGPMLPSSKCYLRHLIHCLDSELLRRIFTLSPASPTRLAILAHGLHDKAKGPRHDLKYVDLTDDVMELTLFADRASPLLRAGAEEGEVVVMETGVTACAGVGRVHASSLWLPSW